MADSNKVSRLVLGGGGELVAGGDVDIGGDGDSEFVVGGNRAEQWVSETSCPQTLAQTLLEPIVIQLHHVNMGVFYFENFCYRLFPLCNLQQA